MGALRCAEPTVESGRVPGESAVLTRTWFVCASQHWGWGLWFGWVWLAPGCEPSCCCCCANAKLLTRTAAASAVILPNMFHFSFGGVRPLARYARRGNVSVHHLVPAVLTDSK